MFERYKMAQKRLFEPGASPTLALYQSPASLGASFTRLRQLLTRLGNPENSLRFIHVTGTSGKGSVTNLVHDMLLADGRSVASYTSPHTTTLLERFRINDRLINPDLLSDAIDTVIVAHQAHLKSGHESLSFFELAVCVAFVAFAHAGVTWCVLEVGMGGRWDATNIIPHKDVAVITNIDLDHTEFLGATLEKIAAEKAGIITGPCHVICGEPRQELRTIIAAQSKIVQASVAFIDADRHDHRTTNAHIASATARAVGVPETAIAQAIKTNRALPCRFEVISNSPRVVIDGAHNVAKMQSTINLLKDQHPVVLFGCKRGKNAKAMIDLLAKHASTIHTTKCTADRGKPMDPAKLLALVPPEKRGQAFENNFTALEAILALNTPFTLITGSLYLAGELRTKWISEDDILTLQSSYK